MPLIGQVAFFILFFVTSCVAVAAGLLRPRLKDRKPCRRWFAIVAGVLAACVMFSTWIGLYGLGQARPGLGGAAFGLFIGLLWGGFFSVLSSRALWWAFDPIDPGVSDQNEQIMNSDVKILIAGAVRGARSFVPNPGFANTGLLPWALLLAAILLPAVWAYAFCWLTWVTEGAPGVEPIMPIKN